MKRLLGWALAMSFVSWVASAEAVSVPMLNCNGLPCVTVEVGHRKPIRLAIDTGDVNTFLDRDVAMALGLAVEPIVGADGKPKPGIMKARVKDVKIGDTSLGDLTVLVGDMKSDKAKDLYPDADGMIAYTAFRNCVLTLDFRDKTISVSSARTMQSHGSMGKLSHPTFGQHGPPIVATTGFAVNGRPITVQVDTLFSGSLLIYPTSVDKLGLTTKARSDKQRFFPFTDGGVNMREASAASETFVGRRLTTNTTIYFATPGVHLPDGLFDGTVGVDLLKNHVVTFDFQANTFSIS